MSSALGFFGVFLLVGAAPLAIKSMRRIRAYRHAQNWQKVPATIVKSLVREVTDSEGTSFLPEFGYRYSIAGTEYNSTVHTEGFPFPSTEEAVRQMIKRFPAGSTVHVAVSPDDPNRAILDTGVPKVWYVLRDASVVAIAIGAAITFIEVVLPK